MSEILLDRAKKGVQGCAMPEPLRNSEISKGPALEVLEQAGMNCLSQDLTQLSGGRSNSVWKANTDAGPYVVKLFLQLDDNPLFPNDAAQEQAALGHYRSFGLAPDIFAGGKNWVIYRYVEALQWSSGAEKVGISLAKLHGVERLATARRLPSGSEALYMQSERIIARCPETLHEALPTLRARSIVPEFDGACGLHGDPVPANILCAEGRTLFIDWQCPAIGDPCEDIAIFLSPAMQVTYRGATLSDNEKHAFWDGYANPDVQNRYERLMPYFHRRMIAYCLWRMAHRQENSVAALAAERRALSECR
jgi:Ser/Thr protein kinase RdoA (MazF antagonist)